MALGARRTLIVRQLLIESLLLAICGGVVGVITAVWGLQLLSALIPDSLSQLQDVTLDTRVLLFAIALSFLTGVVFGTAPAIQASRTEPGDTLNETGRDVSGGVRGRYARRMIVISEVAIAVVLLVGAGLFIRSFHRLSQGGSRILYRKSFDHANGAPQSEVSKTGGQTRIL
jgi:predicted lysophospholipase L1 biosynthesis ABC-type transport system permease subunit